MKAGIYNFTINQGEDFSRLITWKDDNDDPINLTGYTAKMQIRKRKDSDNYITELSTENNRITLGGTAGTVQLSLTSAVTQNLSFGKAVYDLELISAGGIVTRLLEGVVTLSKEVTK